MLDFGAALVIHASVAHPTTDAVAARVSPG
jgi:hypothetical protein